MHFSSYRHCSDLRRSIVAMIIFATSQMFAPATLAADPKKHALLIGNKDYTAAIGVLKNPHNDIKVLEVALKQLEFNVTVVPEAGLARLQAAVNAHVRVVDKAGPGALSFFYYSGHGAQEPTKGVNYLIPIDVTSVEDETFWDRSLRLSDITNKMRDEASNATHFVVFDACRNTLKLPSKDKKNLVQTKGFAPIAKADGILIAFATAEGELADDQGETSGPYARALAEEIVKPGLEAITMFRQVQLRVRRAINQNPWLNFGSFDEFFFAGRGNTGPSLEGGRQQLRLNNLSSARDHFEALAAQGNIDAIHELAQMAEVARDNTAALEWIKKAADLGDRRAKLMLAWFGVDRNSLGDLPKAWEERLAPEQAERAALGLYNAGEREAALVLQELIDNSDEKVPLKIAPQLQREIDAEYGPALAMVGRLIVAKLPASDQLEPAHKPLATRAVQALEKGARLGEALALHRLLLDDDVLALQKAFSIPQPLTPTERYDLLLKAVAQLAGDPARSNRMLTSILTSRSIILDNDEQGKLVKTAVDYLIAGTGGAVDLQRALKLSEEYVAWRESIHKGARKGSMSELKEARRLKAKALLALGRKVEAIDLLYESSDADGLSELFRAANAAGWSPDVESKVLEAFKKHCTDISFSDGTSEPEDCEKAALALVTLKRVAVFAHIHAITREWLQPKEGSPPDDDGQKGRGLLLLARLSEAESTFLRAGETVQDHFTQAARLGAKEARDWLRARNLPIPQIAQAARNDSEKLGDEGRWNAVADKDADKKSLCRATSSHGILTMSVKKDRKPTLVVSAGAPGWGVGSVSYDADVEGIDPPSVRIFVGRDEFVSPVRVAAGRLEPTGDQAALIKRMATAAMVRFEYRVGARILVDVMSLEGFTAVYKTMVTQCADMTSALNVTPADAKSTGPSQSAAPKAPINPSPKATAKAAPQNPAAVAGAPIVLLQRQPNRYFKNDGYRKQSGSTFEQCSALCGGEPRCVAIEFQRANRTCQFYSTVEPSFAATGTDIAVKR